jgi:hypothetical protein
MFNGEQFTDKSSELQAQREERYKNAVEREFNFEIRETIDIYKTPLLLRQVSGLLTILDYERRGYMTPAGRLKSSLIEGKEREITFWFDSDVISMSLPIPFDVREIDKITNNLVKINPQLNINKIQKLIRRASSLGEKSIFYQGYKLYDPDSDVAARYEKNADGLSKDEAQRKGIQENFSIDFIDELLTDDDYKNIWLTLQSLMFSADTETLNSVGEVTYWAESFRTRGGTFLIDPKKAGKIIVDPEVSDQYAFEVWSLDMVPIDSVLGYIEMNDSIDIELDAPVTEHLNGGHSLMSELSLKKEKLNIETLRELFPFIKFSEDNLYEGFLEGLKKYIMDRYKVDPDKITKKQFVYLLIKKMGIPIYNLKGDQLWPERKTHNKIVKELKTKNQGK